MALNLTTEWVAGLVTLGGLVSAPVLVQGFKRRGKGANYQQDFLIQRAPQLASGINVVLIFLSFATKDNFLPGWQIYSLLCNANLFPINIAMAISWLGILILISGLVFMIGGWYSLGEAFSTDAEILDGQTVRKDGLLQFVMHPAYSGIIQSLLGAALASISLLSVSFALFVVAPLWLNRAKYEEKILLEHLGQGYKDYAEMMKWRRLVPRFFPIGV